MVQNWKVSPCYGDEGGSVRWLPVMRVPTGLLIGVADCGHWVVERPDGFVVSDIARKPVSLLPLLETPRNEVQESLIGGVDAHGGFPGAVESFPWREILECALSSGSSYWAERALGWLEAGPDLDEYHGALRQLASSRWAGQRLRHRVQRLLKGSR